jgi:class 3 adenylate cyclase
VEKDGARRAHIGGRAMTESSSDQSRPAEVAKDERRQLTVMFTDLVGSTELASALDPEDWREVLDAYQHRVAEVVKEHGGFLSQFQGDGAVVYFGYPLASESASRDAVAAGLAVVEAVARLAGDLPAELGLKELQARAGVHTGEVVVAAVTAGGNERPPDVWGQVPNLAARLQSAGAPGQVIISGDTAGLVAGYFDTELLGELSLKGIPTPVPAHLVFSRRAARHRLEAKPLSAFVPRYEAQAWLSEQWELIGDGGARLVLVSGEPGIGKSRLILEFTRSLETDGTTVRTVYCSQRESLSPLHPFGGIGDDAPATPEEVVVWAEELAQPGPMLLVVEDAHWADPSTIEATTLIARSEQPLLVLVTARPELVDATVLVPHSHLVLGPLSDDEAQDLLDHLTQEAGVPADARDELVDRAEGVPLFLEELVRSVADRVAGLASPTPTSISELITARLDRLGAARPLAQSASVIGRSFDRTVLLSVSGLDEATLDENLHRLIEHAIVEPVGDQGAELQFRHALFHEAAYRSVMRPDRVRIHGAVGELLVQSGRSAGRPEIAAYHLGAAGRADEAVPLWQQAGRNARKHARFREAAGHEREVLALLPRLPEDSRDRTELNARGKLMICLTAVDQSHPDALSESQRIEELATVLEDRPALLRSYMVLVPWWQASAEYKTINDILARARQEAEALGDQWFLMVISMFESTIGFWQGNVAEGLERMRTSYAESGFPLEESVASLPAMQSVEFITLCGPRVATALACWLHGDVAEGWRVADDVLHEARERNVPQAIAVVAVTAALMAQMDGDRALVAKLCTEACNVADEVSTRQWRQWARSLLWWAGEGLEEPEVPGPLLRPYFLMLLAEERHAPRALALLDEALDTARATGERFCEPEILRARAVLRAKDGELESAAAGYQDAVELAREQGSRMLELKALTDWVRLPGAPDQARSDLARLAEELGSGGHSRSVDAAMDALARP